MRSLARKNVLITGGLGFIGSNLAIRLLEDGARVAVCDAMIEGYGGNFANVREVLHDLDVHISDVRDEEGMARLVEGRDVVFHLAAQVSHVLSLSNPYPDIDINIKGTAALLEACRKTNPGALVVRSGTRGQYGPAVTLPVSEETPADPRGIYEISQLSAEMICRTYTRIHGVRTVPLRLTNVYGPRGQMKHSHFGVVNWFVRQVLDDLVPAFERLRQQGKIRFLGITALGDTAALHQVIDARVFDSAQVVYNMLNPSAGSELPASYPAQDYGRLFDATQAAGVGVVGIRVLAGGALSGSAERHPIAGPAPEPIGSAMSYHADIDRARRLMPLVEEGCAASLTEAATRFALSHPAMGTILVGMATPQQFEDALTAAEKGPLPQAALDRLSALRQAFSGEPR